jgi:hypothetical protein
VVRLAGDCPADGRDAVAAFQLAAVHGEDGDDAAGSLVDAVGDPLGRNVVAFAVIESPELRAARLGHQNFAFMPAKKLTGPLSTSRVPSDLTLMRFVPVRFSPSAKISILSVTR